ncbi:sporulation protein YunB [Chengkuizengella axinellae]|uniref:Sporulation protein YunB n=1 Tax=Chengkuizengella axinellae TaxID=3064388 RepID=A0ABT9IT56_9BACL|nr:sporulation protein YunB [Chengkuizengella sp. 2205SS18-9]MDP5272523.1 sporulation protein YunB [Chengkuizengella sp. 2205SS18-9]
MRRKRRWKSRKAVKRGSKKKVFFLVVLIFTLISVQSFIFVERNLRPPLMNVAKIRIKQIATQSINASITEQISRGTDVERLIEWQYDHTGKITGFMLNYSEHMRIASETVSIVQKTLDDLQKVPESIPLGQALDSAIIASFGPEVPIKFVPAGAVKVDLNTRKEDAGINMILVEVYIRIITEVTIIIPFDTEPEIVETEVPITYLLVVGDVPTYYFDNNGKPMDSLNGTSPIPPISLPEFNQIEENDTQTEN